MAVEHQKFLSELLERVSRDDPDWSFLDSQLQLTKAYLDTRDKVLGETSSKSISRHGPRFRRETVELKPNKIGELRVELNLTQQEIVTGTGFSKGYISLVERGLHSRTSKEFARKLAEVLGVEMSELVLSKTDIAS